MFCQFGRIDSPNSSPLARIPFTKEKCLSQNLLLLGILSIVVNPRAFGSYGPCQRQRNTNNRALSRATAYTDISIQSLDKASHNGQAQPCSDGE